MTEIRPLQSADIPSVASLFMAIMRGSQGTPPGSLVDYLRSLFLEGPAADADICSRVYIRNGGVAGFIGVTVQAMQAGNRRIRAAICGNLMVRDHRQDPLAGARLLRAFLAGPQDLSLSETAGDASLAMWRQAGGSLLPLHSLDWVRVIEPASFAVRTLQTRVRAAGLLAPVAAMLDSALRRKRGDNTLRWSSLPFGFAPRGPQSAEPVDEAAASEAIAAMASQYKLVPLWSEAAMLQVLQDGAAKSAYGELRRCVVRNKRGQTIGIFQYHLRQGGIAQVLFVLSLPGSTGLVVDALIADAAGRGAAAVRGRTDPQLFGALLGRRVLMLHTEASLAHSRDAGLIADIERGDGLCNGIVGERWTRLIGHDFN